MKNKHLSLLLFAFILFSLVAYSVVDSMRANRTIQIPDAFLGLWFPQSPTLPIAMIINPDGTYQYVSRKKFEEIRATGIYKVFKIEKTQDKERVFLLVHEIDLSGKFDPSYSYYVLEKNGEAGMRLFNLYADNINNEEWDFPSEDHKAKWDQILARMEGSGLDSDDGWTPYIRK